MHRDEVDEPEVRGDRFRTLVSVESHADGSGPEDEVVAAQAPQRKRHDQPAVGGKVAQQPVLADEEPGLRVVKQPPAVAYDPPMPDERCHKRIP